MSALVAMGYQAVGLNKIRQKKVYVAGQTVAVEKPQKPVAGLPTLQDIAKQNVMGVPVKKGGKSPAADAAKVASLKFTLMGTIVATGGGKSSAFIQGSNKESHRYYVGDTLESGVILQAVDANSVVLKRNGKPETLKYPENVATNTPPQPAPPIVPPPARPNRAVPVGSQQQLAPGVRPADRLMNLRERLKNMQSNPGLQPRQTPQPPAKH